MTVDDYGFDEFTRGPARAILRPVTILASSEVDTHRPYLAGCQQDGQGKDKEPRMAKASFETPWVDLFSMHELPLSPVVISDGLVFISGQTPRDPTSPGYPEVVSPEFDAQAHRVFENMKACLAAAGCEFKHVLKVQVFLHDWCDFEEFNKIYSQYFTKPLPSRTVVGSDLNDILLEVECIARQPVQTAPTPPN